MYFQQFNPTSKEEAEIGFSKGVAVGDEEFGGTEERKKMERKLLRKLDLRMSILIVFYILNYVSCQIRRTKVLEADSRLVSRSTGIMPAQHVYVDSRPTFI